MLRGSSFDTVNVHIEHVEIHVHNKLLVDPEWEEDEEEEADDDDDGDVPATPFDPEDDPGDQVDPIYSNGRRGAVQPLT